MVELTEEGAERLAGSRTRWDALVAGWQDLVGAGDLATVRHALEAYLDAHPPEA